MACQCARCEFDRENDGISFGNEMGAIRSIFAPPAPDEQARAEVEANLNRPPLRNACTDVSDDSDLLNALVEASETLSSFFSVALNLAEELRTEVRELETAIDYELEKSDFLEAALQHYASHAWNDFKRHLEKRYGSTDS